MTESAQTKKNKEWRVCIGVPLPPAWSTTPFHHFIRIANQGWEFLPLPYTRNDIARNKFAAAALRGGYDWLIMLDSDHKHPADIVHRLLRHPAANPEIRVVGGLNFRRGEPHDPCAFVIGDDGQTYSMVEWEQGLIEVDAIGTGSIAIHTSVFKELPFPWFGYDYSGVTDPDHGWPGTDIYFSRLCRECRDAGISMYVDTTTVSPHITEKDIDEAAYREYMERDGQYRVVESVAYEDIKQGRIVANGAGHPARELVQ